MDSPPEPLASTVVGGLKWGTQAGTVGLISAPEKTNSAENQEAD